jgi:FkbM family methyltransferase
VKNFLKIATGIECYIKTVGLKGFFIGLKGKIFNSFDFLEIKRHDCKSSFQLRVPSSDVGIYEQIFFDKEYDFFAAIPPRVILDAGANIGLTSIYFANKYPDALIFSIEPEKKNFELLITNTKSYSNITPIHAALWDKNEEINLIDVGLGECGFMTGKESLSNCLSGDISHIIPGMTVDKIMEEYDIDEIDILKVDIEGAEKEVFSRTSLWIGRVNSIIIELHDRMKSGCSRSFYKGTNNERFNVEWSQGDSVYLSKDKFIEKTDS